MHNLYDSIFFKNNYCGYFIKEIPNGFLCLDTLIQTLGMLLDFQMDKKHKPSGSCFFTLFESLAISSVFGSQYPARKTICYFFNPSEHQLQCP